MKKPKQLRLLLGLPFGIRRLKTVFLNYIDLILEPKVSTTGKKPQAYCMGCPKG
jgi:hypothetical protein